MRGWDVQTVREIVADTLHNIVDPLVYDEAVGLIEEHHLAGRDVIIVSTSGPRWSSRSARCSAPTSVVATRMEVVDGQYTGGINFYAYAEAKATAIRELAEENGYDLDRCYAYSDSVTDVHMLEAVGHPYAVNPDKDLRRIARDRGWPILVFDKPVALRSRSGSPPARPTLAALTVGGVAAHRRGRVAERPAPAACGRLSPSTPRRPANVKD